MTATEREIALWIAEGHSNERIASWLGRSVCTAERMVAGLFKKLPQLAQLRRPSGIRHRTRAASQFGREGMNIDSL